MSQSEMLSWGLTVLGLVVSLYGARGVFREDVQKIQQRNLSRTLEEQKMVQVLATEHFALTATIGYYLLVGMSSLLTMASLVVFWAGFVINMLPWWISPFAGLLVGGAIVTFRASTALFKAMEHRKALIESLPPDTANEEVAAIDGQLPQ